jgi:outer membrane biosynthesis protein TonB
VRQAILIMLMFLALVLSPRPSAPTPKPPPVKADKVVAPKPFTLPLPTPARVITESYQAFPSEPAFTLPVEAMRVDPPAEQPKPVVAAAAPNKAAKREPDICRGKGRSYYNNGRSWRCNR